MNERCDNCNQNVHCNGKDTYNKFEQDGLHTYICQCFCGKKHRTLQNAAYALSPLIRRYGRELLLEVLMNDQRR